MNEIKNPAYRVLLPQWEGDEPWFELTSEQCKTVLGGRPHRVAPMDKSLPVHEMADTCESLLAVYPNAISIGGILGAGPERGDATFGAIGTTLIAVAFLFVSIYSSLISPSPSFFVAVPAFLFFSLGAVKLIRVSFLPKDNPIIFNKMTRQVIFSQIRFHSFWRFWEMPGFNPPIIISWESIQVRSYKFAQYMGSSLRDSYRLEIWAPIPDDPKKLLVKESLGYLGWYEDEKLWQLYEHIRRYMEEGGPAIQHGEKLRKPRKGRDLPAFPEAVLTTLGGPALSDEEVERLAEITPPQAII